MLVRGVPTSQPQPPPSSLALASPLVSLSSPVAALVVACGIVVTPPLGSTPVVPAASVVDVEVSSALVLVDDPSPVLDDSPPLLDSSPPSVGSGSSPCAYPSSTSSPAITSSPTGTICPGGS